MTTLELLCAMAEGVISGEKDWQWAPSRYRTYVWLTIKGPKAEWPGQVAKSLGYLKTIGDQFFWEHNDCFEYFDCEDPGAVARIKKRIHEQLAVD